MATASRFRQLAAELETLATAIINWPVSIQPPGTSMFVGGDTPELIAATLDVSSTNCRRLRERIDELADECRRRAEVCADYSQQVRLHISNPQDYDRPRRPASWVDYGW